MMPTIFRCVGSAWAIDPSRVLLVNRHGDSVASMALEAARSLLAERLWSVLDLRRWARDAGVNLGALGGAGVLDPFVFESPKPTMPIFVIVTADRVRVCARAVTLAMEEIGAHAAGDGRLLIVDQSSDAQQGALQIAVQSLADRYKVPAVIATPAAATALANAIGRHHPLDMPAARFALTAQLRGATRVGTARNLASLLTLGCSIVSIDDDVAGPVLGRRDVASAPALGSAVLRLRPLRDTNLAGWSSTTLLGSHTAWLGGTVGRAVPLRIAVTVSALRGDCAAEAPWAEMSLGTACGQTLTRQVFRGAVQPTLTFAGHGLMCYAFGAVNDGRLPPFPPMGRHEDGAFAATLGFLEPDAVVCHLPVCVAHAPAIRRSDATYRDVPVALSGRWRTNDVLALLIRRLHADNPIPPRRRRLVEVLRRLGQSLRNGRSSEFDDLRYLYYQRRLQTVSEWAETADGRTQRRVQTALRRWDTRRYWDERAMTAEWPENAWPALGQYIESYAAMIEAWPHVSTAVKALEAWRWPWTQLGPSDGIVHVRPR